MLKDILVRIQRNNVLSKSQLAREFSVTESVIDEAISQLIRMGYLKEEASAPECGTSCVGCAYATMCHKNPVQFYELTERSKALLA